jgi:hypothetical protein
MRRQQLVKETHVSQLIFSSDPTTGLTCDNCKGCCLWPFGWVRALDLRSQEH